MESTHYRITLQFQHTVMYGTKTIVISTPILGMLFSDNRRLDYPSLYLTNVFTLIDFEYRINIISNYDT